VRAAMRLMVGGVACLALAVPPAAAQDRKPSAAELRDTYPLRTNARAEQAAARTAVPPSAAAEQPATGSGRKVTQFALLALLSALAFAVGFALSVRPRRRQRVHVPEPRAAPPRRVDPRLLSTENAAPVGLPPAPRRAWTSEINWREIEGEPRFCVVARTERGGGEVVLMMSAPLEWPPAGPEGVQALRDAAEALEASLLGAGWTALPPGKAWYEKRFAWHPAEPVPGSDRFTRTPAGVSNS
jgi:hypothetical protein